MALRTRNHLLILGLKFYSAPTRAKRERPLSYVICFMSIFVKVNIIDITTDIMSSNIDSLFVFFADLRHLNSMF